MSGLCVVVVADDRQGGSFGIHGTVRGPGARDAAALHGEERLSSSQADRLAEEPGLLRDHELRQVRERPLGFTLSANDTLEVESSVPGVVPTEMAASPPPSGTPPFLAEQSLLPAGMSRTRVRRLPLPQLPK